MTRLFVAGCFFLAGCGIHNFESESKLPTHRDETRVEVGPFNSSSKSDTAAVSSYRVCLAKLEGYPDREAFCRLKIAAGLPGQLGVYGLYGMYGAYGYSPGIVLASP